jgi:hypothetical protein
MPDEEKGSLVNHKTPDFKGADACFDQQTIARNRGMSRQ